MRATLILPLGMLASQELRPNLPDLLKEQ